jgi:diguanylate cyclase (GGDEF)-like protein
MSEQQKITKEIRDAWPVPDTPGKGTARTAKDLDLPKGDQGEFLLNLLSSKSRHRLLPLTDLPRDSLIQAFLGGGANDPHISTLFTSKEENERLTTLIELPIFSHIERIELNTLQHISANPPHLLIVHLEDDNPSAEKTIEVLLKEPTLTSLSVVILVKDESSPYYQSEPVWAQAVLPMTMKDTALRGHLKNLLDLARARMDLETIYLAHRLSREQLHIVQFTDPLTGLLNRRGFEDAGARELSRVARTGETAGLVIIDIDRFKGINDTHGHPAGDDVLRELAGILRDETRTLDHVFRFGGEEFGLILPHTQHEEMILMAERIRREVKKNHFRAMPDAGAVTVSMGALSIGSTLRPTLDDVYPVADALLYRAKHEGRNRVVSDKFH